MAFVDDKSSPGQDDVGTTSVPLKSSDSSSLPDAFVSSSQVTPPPAASVPDPPPDGGAFAWFQVLGAFLLSFNAWGIVNSYGLYQPYYETGLLANESPNNISWIGSIQAYLLMAFGAFTGPVFDLGYLRTLLAAGTFLIPFGLFMTSISHKYWQLVLAQGFCLLLPSPCREHYIPLLTPQMLDGKADLRAFQSIGLGQGCIFCPMLSIVPQYFTQRKGMAIGITQVGNALGGVIYPIIFHQLQPRMGFRWATRVIAFIAFATLSMAFAVMKVRVLPKQRRALFHPSVLKELPFTTYCIAFALGFVGFLCPCRYHLACCPNALPLKYEKTRYYIQPWALHYHITGPNLALYLLPIISASSILGRTLPNLAAERFGSINVIFICAVISGILCLCWTAAKSTASLIVFAVLYGFFSGIMSSLAAVPIIELTPDKRFVGTWMGMALFISALGFLVGAPVSGAIVEHTGSYFGVSMLAGFSYLGMAILLIVTRLLKHGTKLWVKV